MTEPRHEERAHATLGASGAHRWMACPGSIRLSEGVADKGSIYAAEGTAAHELGEKCLRSGAAAADHLGEQIVVGNHVFEVTEEMAEAVQVYLDAVRADYEDGDTLFIEAKFSLAHLYPGMFGTNDAALYKPSTKTLSVYDYKHGAGKVVKVEGNPQLIYYGIGCLSLPDMKTRPIDTVELVIVQPRAPGAPVRRWTADVMDLLAFSGDLVAAAIRTEQPDAPLKAGDWCKFCPVEGSCPENRAASVRGAQEEFGPDTHELTGEQIAAILAEADRIRSWISAVSNEAFNRMKGGLGVPGYKLVAKRARRKWINEEDAANTLRLVHGLGPDDLYSEPSLRSPAQLEKLVPKADRSMLASLFEAVSSGVSLVPESDKRPPADAAAVSAADDFND